MNVSGWLHDVMQTNHFVDENGLLLCNGKYFVRCTLSSSRPRVVRSLVCFADTNGALLEEQGKA